MKDIQITSGASKKRRNKSGEATVWQSVKTELDEADAPYLDEIARMKRSWAIRMVNEALEGKGNDTSLLVWQRVDRLENGRIVESTRHEWNDQGGEHYGYERKIA